MKFSNVHIWCKITITIPIYKVLQYFVIIITIVQVLPLKLGYNGRCGIHEIPDNEQWCAVQIEMWCWMLKKLVYSVLCHQKFYACLITSFWHKNIWHGNRQCSWNIFSSHQFILSITFYTSYQLYATWPHIFGMCSGKNRTLPETSQQKSILSVWYTSQHFFCCLQLTFFVKVAVLK